MQRSWVIRRLDKSVLLTVKEGLIPMVSDVIDDPRPLARIQEALVKMLKNMNKVHRELNIPYSVYGRTMIGVIRCKGSVPWDDDIDVLMTRRDCERFLIETLTLVGPRYRFDNTHTLPGYPYILTKLDFTGTLLIPEFAKNVNYHMPICLGVLPLDAVPTDLSDFRR